MKYRLMDNIIQCKDTGGWQNIAHVNDRNACELLVLMANSMSEIEGIMDGHYAQAVQIEEKTFAAQFRGKRHDEELP